MTIRLATLLLATALSAQALETPAAPSPVRQTLIDALGPRAAELGKTPTFDALVAAMTPEIRVAAKAKLDALDRAPLTPAVLTDLSKVYSLLGDHSSAAQAGLALQEREPKATQGLVLASNAQLDAGDYAGSVKLAEQALKIDPKDPAALAVWHTAKGRVSPTSRAGQPQSTDQHTAGSVQTATAVDDRPLQQSTKKPVMGAVPDFKKDAPVDPASSGRPWVPYAVGFSLTAIGIGLAIKHKLEDAKGAVLQAEDKVEEGATNLYFKGKDWVQENPKKSIAAIVVGSVVVVAITVASLPAVGGGGLAIAIAGGGTEAVGVAGSIGVLDVAAGGAAVALMSGDGRGSSSQRASDDEPSAEQLKPDVENVRWDPAKKRWVDDEWVYKWDRAIHDKRGGQPHWDRGNIRTGRQEWSPDGKTWIRK